MKDVHISNPEEVENKIAKIKADGINHFHVVSDFDRTFTPGFIKGEKPTTSFAQIRRGGYLDKEYEEKAEALFAHYRPIELDETLSPAERGRHMTEWWEAHLGLMVQYRLTRDMIKDIVGKGKIELRKGIAEFIAVLERKNVPLLIFSAGVGNIMQEFFILREKLHKNMHIISNFVEYDEKGAAKSFTKPVIHPFNKNEGQAARSGYHTGIGNRKNVLLLGDTLGDLDMLKGLTHETVLKIGFLNEKVEEMLEQFAKEYDVVILNDGPMDYVNELIKKIL